MFRDKEPLQDPAEEPIFRRRQNKTAKVFQDYMNAIMLSIVGFLVIFVAMAYMTRITFGGDLNWRDVTFQSLFMYICTVSIHLILRSYARRKGRETEGWKAAKAKLSENREKIIKGDLTLRVSEYCRAWEVWDVDNVRKRILSEVCISLEKFKVTYNLYTEEELPQKFPDLTKEQVKAIVKAKHVKRLHYDESYITDNESHGIWRSSPSGGIKTKTIIRIQTAQTLFTTAIASIFSVSIGVELIVNPTFATVVMCLIKLSVLLIMGVVGMVSGYNFAANRETNEMISRIDEQDRFLKWCEKDLPINGQDDVTPIDEVPREDTSEIDS